MQLNFLRHLVKSYEKSWYIHKWMSGEHKEISALKKYLNSLANKPDDYTLTSTDLLCLIQTIGITITLDVIQEIYNYIPDSLLQMMPRLIDLQLATESNFEKLSNLSENDRQLLGEVLIGPVTSDFYLFFDALFSYEKQGVLDLLFSISDHPYSPSKVKNLLLALHQHHLLNDHLLTQLTNDPWEVFYLAKLMPYLQNLKIVREDLVNQLLASHSMLTMFNILKRLKQTPTIILDDVMVIELIERANQCNVLNELTSALAGTGCLNNQTLTFLLNQDLYRCYSSVSILKQLQSFPVVDLSLLQRLFALEMSFYFEDCVKILVSFGLISREIINKLIDNATGVDRIFSYIKKQGILNALTVKQVIQAMLNDTLSPIIDFKEYHPNVTEATFLNLCLSPRLHKINAMLKYIEQPVSDVILQDILLLSDKQFDYVARFIEDKHRKLTFDLEAVEKMLVYVVQFMPHDQEHATTVTPPSNKIQVLTWHPKTKTDLAHNDVCFQQLLAKYYLQPFPSSIIPPENTGKRTVIEREIHGAMHAGRVSLYTCFLHECFKSWLPDFTGEVVSCLTQQFKISEKQLLLLIRFAALSHDSARLNDGNDLWDKESARNCEEELIAQGIDKQIASIFSQAIAFKDAPNAYLAFLKKQGIAHRELIYYDYIRQLIYLADCLDIMRCAPIFTMEKLFDVIASLPGYDKSKHENNVIELVVNVRQFIHKQADMLLDCKLQLPDGHFIDVNDATPHYVLNKKIKIEQASNVLGVLAKAMCDIPFFKKYLHDTLLPTGELASVASPFNPYIHGTTSMVFATLPKTQQSLLPVKTMLDTLQLAPMGGEIESRELTGPYQGTDICLARMLSNTKGQYDLNAILNDYAYRSRNGSPEQEKIIKMLKYEVDKAYQRAFSNLGVIPIYLARAKQFGIEPSVLNKTIDVPALTADIDAMLQGFYLLLLFGQYIKPADLGALTADQRADLENAIYTQFTFSNMIEKIKQQQIDVKAIVNHPTKEALQKIVALFSLPSTLEVCEMNAVDRKYSATLSLQQAFVSSTTSSPIVDGDVKKARAKAIVKDMLYAFRRFDDKDNDKYNRLLANYAGNAMWHIGKYDDDVMASMHKPLLEYIQTLEQSKALLEKVWRHAIPFSNQQHFFINHCFPVVFLCDQGNNKISLCGFASGEYRTQKGLMLGEDIKIIATDTEEHRLTLLKYLEQNHVNQVNIVLFNDLYLSLLSQKAPRSPLQHSDGFLKLSWLASRALPEKTQATTGNKSIDRLINKVERYRQLAI